MKIAKRVLTVCVSAALGVSMLSGCENKKDDSSDKGENKMEKTAVVHSEYQKLEIDGSTVNTNPASAYRGLGVVTGNNSSRLLMDYKDKNPEAYHEIMRLLFEKNYGAGLSHIKIEFGTDVNSSSGTEPCVMRSADEQADVTRGAGFMFAADALEINPDITVDLLRWGEPKWVTDAFEESAEAGFAARYKWYKSTIDAAYDEYGIKFSYISADGNEPDKVDTDWIIYFANELENETDERYDYGKIKIVASDEVGTWKIADELLNNEELLNAVDVLGEHYNTYGNDSTKILNEEYGKEIWYSEGIAPTNMSKYNDGGINGENGALDVCNRIINSYYNGKMTMYEYQPAVAAYYNGAKYFPKSLINAQEPWSGYFEVDSGVWTSAHFTHFIKKGWQFVDSGCFGDGKENHSITETTNNYMTACDPETGDYSTVICNDSEEQRNYTITVSNLNKDSSAVYVWETRGNAAEDYRANWFKNTDSFVPVNNGDGTYSYSVEVKPYSVVTLTTLETEQPDAAQEFCEFKSSALDINYSDDFEYDDEWLAARGSAPLYTTDQGGAFEVAEIDGNKVLMQQITAENMPTDWRLRSTPAPITSLGDDRWSNYSVSCDFMLDKSGNDENYVQLGLRYVSSEIESWSAESGYAIRIYANGTAQLRKDGIACTEGEIKGFDNSKVHNMKITANGRNITAYCDGEKILTYEEDGCFYNSGRVSLASDYFNNWFDNLKVEPIDGVQSAVTRIDDHNNGITYSGSWNSIIPDSYISYYRTISKATAAGDEFSFKFSGTGFALIGNGYVSTLKIEIDSEVAEESIDVPASGDRQSPYRIDGLDDGEHEVKVTVLDGKFALDAIEY
ncbi:MAG: glycosyl hydrolase family 59 [Ruminococcus sp.]|nr:glycosyl hydrolase family 59 [Ruminococcus sp.]